MDWFIDLRAHSHGGPIGTLKISDGSRFFPATDGLLADIQGRDVILMAHGYNVNRPHGQAALTQWKQKLQHGIGDAPVFIGVLWPGDCILPIFVDYIWEGSEAEKSGTMLGAFVRDNFGSAASLTFISHSLGARVVLEAIQTLTDPIRVRHLILLAGAIEDDTLLHEFNAAALRVDRISIVYSLEDEVLKLAYPVGNLIGGIVERGDANVKAALGRHGPSQPWFGKILANPRLPTDWNYGHTDYMSNSAIVGDFAVPIPDLGDPQTPGSMPSYLPAPLTTVGNGWKPCWSPAFAATRWLRP